MHTEVCARGYTPAREVDRRIHTVYLDIETYRRGRAFLDEKIIAIGVLDNERREPTMFLEWESNEGEIIKEFYSYIMNLNRQYRLVIVGFGILRFDIPLLIQKGVEYCYNHKELNAFWYDTLTIDLMQIMLPANNFRFKGNSLDNLVSKAREIREDINELYMSGEDIAELYENENYEEIIMHLRRDLEVIMDIYSTRCITNIINREISRNNT